MTTDAKGARNSTRGDQGQHATTLTDAIKGDLLPSPSVADGTGGHTSRSGARKDEVLLGGIANLLPTPRAARGASTTETSYALGGERTDAGRPQGEVLLPTPTARLGDPKQRGASHPARRHELCSKRAGELDEVATHLLPSPFARDYKGAYPRADKGECLPGALEELAKEQVDDGQQVLLDGGERDPWGKYGPAIRRWERIVGPAPSPTEPNTRGGRRLSPAFSEWLMGWESGWVTDLPISRPDKLKLAGNGVVPQQCAAALRQLIQYIGLP